ncbi:uncharacterized protein AB675_8758 [Cyphellophora attinorum]|uniref:Lysine-specific metallo-endopeptidase domain-containing protein n=1 Tax=Cyphellophora attinorum TaxID=1664694 RepID=A0A0N0NRC7_9EURO|nr:uncharacterized protein AB675_8758 [Phialophora attinorum]KPI44679.1 hypothetical protein AB675_8758 [Phialophora attinorum]
MFAKLQFLVVLLSIGVQGRPHLPHILSSVWHDVISPNITLGREAKEWRPHSADAAAVPDLFLPPRAPILRNFPDTNTQNMAVTAFFDALNLAFSGYKALMGQCKPGWQPPATYLRYFPPEPEDARGSVQDALLAVIGPSPYGPAEMDEPGYSFAIYYEEVVDVPESIAELDQRMCSHNDPPNAYFGESDEDSAAWMVICPKTFENQKDLSHTTCEELPDGATAAMDVPGATVLHEFLHWHRMTTNIGTLEIVDYNIDDLGINLIDPKAWPKTGYGPENAQALNEVFQRWDPSDMSEEHLTRAPWLNADNYVYFCLESYWEEKCAGKHFGDAPRPPPINALR